jgi:hypothetical protein
LQHAPYNDEVLGKPGISEHEDARVRGQKVI